MASHILNLFAFLIVLFFFLILVMLITKSVPVIRKNSIAELIFSSKWDTDAKQFGFFPAIIGTLEVTLLSMLFAIPVSMLTAIYISEYASSSIKTSISAFIDVLSGIPSVVFGLCALLYLVPAVSMVMKKIFSIQTTGMCVITASLTLSVMTLPVIISLIVESLQLVPKELREVSLSLGATKWQSVKKILFRAAGPGIISAILLGFGRAFGETMAVAMIIGSKNKIPVSVFSAGETLPSLIVNSFGEMMSVPLQQSALIFVALILFIIVMVTNSVAKMINIRLSQKWRY
ncbi:MAG: phosphate ABC transporter permease subunit PstC [Candidatus Marinimicrobia bacterium]|nr:phosphate ABC transporter permease subunit PstC [Candidatus Neomarinimicrobiota bacterium]